MTNLSAIDQINDILADLKKLDVTALSDDQLVPLIKAVQSVGMFAAAVDAEITRRAIDMEKLLPGVIVKTAVTHRKWNDQEAAEQLAREEFGDDAFETTLKSPAKIEKMGDKGKQFVAVASYKPDGGKKATY